MQVERALGNGFVFSRDRWGTPDGYIPYRVLLAAYQVLPAVQAADRLQVVRAVRLAQAGSEGQRVLDREVALANGE